MGVRIRIVTIPFSENLQGFDEAPLAALARQAEIVDLSAHFFIHGGCPYWTCLATCVPRSSREEIASPSSAKHWKSLLQEGDAGLFQTLREWRAKEADARGIPAFLILTNWQFAEICRARPTTLAALGAIDGIGPSRLKKYGRKVLEIVGQFSEIADCTPVTSSTVEDEIQPTAPQDP
ncbi:MAG: HRDC domain-containing protein [Candidatus Eisenbacteria sp.]|nr:HRDC domain-containing protein [Candidatus Eisenbacteria bacterium]